MMALPHHYQCPSTCALLFLLFVVVLVAGDSKPLFSTVLDTSIDKTYTIMNYIPSMHNGPGGEGIWFHHSPTKLSKYEGGKVLEINNGTTMTPDEGVPLRNVTLSFSLVVYVNSLTKDVFIYNSYKIFQVVNGTLHKIVGTGTSGFDNDNVKANSTKIQAVSSMSSNENFLFIQHNYRIRKIDLRTNIIYAVIGKGTSSATPNNSTADSTTTIFGASGATGPVMTYDSSLYFASSQVYNISNGRVYLIAGVSSTCTVDLSITDPLKACFIKVIGLQVYQGELYILEANNIRKLTKYGTLQVVAGNLDPLTLFDVLATQTAIKAQSFLISNNKIYIGEPPFIRVIDLYSNLISGLIGSKENYNVQQYGIPFSDKTKVTKGTKGDYYFVEGVSVRKYEFLTNKFTCIAYFASPVVSIYLDVDLQTNDAFFTMESGSFLTVYQFSNNTVSIIADSETKIDNHFNLKSFKGVKIYQDILYIVQVSLVVTYNLRKKELKRYFGNGWHSFAYTSGLGGNATLAHYPTVDIMMEMYNNELYLSDTFGYISKINNNGTLQVLVGDIAQSTEFNEVVKGANLNNTQASEAALNLSNNPQKFSLTLRYFGRLLTGEMWFRDGLSVYKVNNNNKIVAIRERETPAVMGAISIDVDPVDGTQYFNKITNSKIYMGSSVLYDFSNSPANIARQICSGSSLYVFVIFGSPTNSIVKVTKSNGNVTIIALLTDTSKFSQTSNSFRSAACDYGNYYYFSTMVDGVFRYSINSGTISQVLSYNRTYPLNFYGKTTQTTFSANYQTPMGNYLYFTHQGGIVKFDIVTETSTMIYGGFKGNGMHREGLFATVDSFALSSSGDFCFFDKNTNIPVLGKIRNDIMNTLMYNETLYSKLVSNSAKAVAVGPNCYYQIGSTVYDVEGNVILNMPLNTIGQTNDGDFFIVNGTTLSMITVDCTRDEYFDCIQQNYSCYGVEFDSDKVCSGNGDCIATDTCQCYENSTTVDCSQNSTAVNNVTIIDNSTHVNETNNFNSSTTNNTLVGNNETTTANETSLSNNITLNNSTLNNTRLNNTQLVNNTSSGNITINSTDHTNFTSNSSDFTNSTTNSNPTSNNITLTNDTISGNGTNNSTNIVNNNTTLSGNFSEANNSTNTSIITNTTSSDNTTTSNSSTILTNTTNHLQNSTIDTNNSSIITNYTRNDTNPAIITTNSTSNFTNNVNSSTSSNNTSPTNLTCYGIEANSSMVCNSKGVCKSQDNCECYSNAIDGFFTSKVCSTCQSDYYGKSCLTRYDGPLRLNNEANGVEIKITAPYWYLSLFIQCSLLIHSSDLKLFGDSPKCYWKQKETNLFIIEFGNGFDLTIGNSIRLNTLTFDGIIPNDNTNYLNFIVESPLNAIKPIGIISTRQNFYSTCESVIIDASNSYSLDRKPLSYIWSILQSPNSLSFSDTNLNSTLIISKEESSVEGDYIIRLQVESSFTKVRSEIVDFKFTKSNTAFPILTIDSYSNQINAKTLNAPIIVEKKVSLPSCYSNLTFTSDIKVVWNQIEGNPLDYIVNSNSDLEISNFPIKGSYKYSFNVIATFEGKSVPTDITIQTSSENLFCNLFIESLTTDSAAIVIETQDIEQSSEVETWTLECYESDSHNSCGSIIDNKLSNYAIMKSTSLELQSNDFNSLNGKFSIILTVTKGQRSMSSSISLQFPKQTQQLPPLISLLNVSPNRQKLTLNDILNLQLSVTKSDGTDAQNIARNWLLNSKPIPNNYLQLMSSPLSTSNSIILLLNDLEEGSLNVLTLQATDMDTQLSTLYSYSFSIAKSPPSCPCSISPSTGYALETDFTFNCVNCQNKENTLAFSLAFIDDKSGAEIPLIIKGGNTFSTKLPYPISNPLVLNIDIVDTDSGASVSNYQKISILLPQASSVKEIKTKVTKWNSFQNSLQLNDLRRMIFNSAIISRTSEAMISALSKRRSTCLNGGVYDSERGKCSCPIGYAKKDCSLTMEDFTIVKEFKKELFNNFYNAFAKENGKMSELYLIYQLYGIDSLLSNYDEIDADTFSKSLDMMKKLVKLSYENEQLSVQSGATNLFANIFNSFYNYNIYNDCNCVKEMILQFLPILKTISQILLRGKYVGESDLRFQVQFLSLLTNKNYRYYFKNMRTSFDSTTNITITSPSQQSSLLTSSRTLLNFISTRTPNYLQDIESDTRLISTTSSITQNSNITSYLYQRDSIISQLLSFSENIGLNQSVSFSFKNNEKRTALENRIEYSCVLIQNYTNLIIKDNGCQLTRDYQQFYCSCSYQNTNNNQIAILKSEFTEKIEETPLLILPNNSNSNNNLYYLFFLMIVVVVVLVVVLIIVVLIVAKICRNRKKQFEAAPKQIELSSV